MDTDTPLTWPVLVDRVVRARREHVLATGADLPGQAVVVHPVAFHTLLATVPVSGKVNGVRVAAGGVPRVGPYVLRRDLTIPRGVAVVRYDVPV